MNLMSVPGMFVCSNFLVSVCMFIVTKVLLISSATVTVRIVGANLPCSPTNPTYLSLLRNRHDIIVHSNRFIIVTNAVIFLIMSIEKPHKISVYFIIITFNTRISS